MKPASSWESKGSITIKPLKFYFIGFQITIRYPDRFSSSSIINRNENDRDGSLKLYLSFSQSQPHHLVGDGLQPTDDRKAWCDPNEDRKTLSEREKKTMGIEMHTSVNLRYMSAIMTAIQ